MLTLHNARSTNYL